MARYPNGFSCYPYPGHRVFPAPTQDRGKKGQEETLGTRGRSTSSSRFPRLLSHGKSEGQGALSPADTTAGWRGGDSSGGRCILPGDVLGTSCLGSWDKAERLVGDLLPHQPQVLGNSGSDTKASQ